MKKTKEEKELDRLAKEELEAEKDLQEKPLEFLTSFLDKDEEEVEFEQFYKERYPEEYAEEQREKKRIIITAAVSFSSLIILTIVGILIFNEIFKSDLLKYTKPYMENYYLEKYGEEAKIDEIDYLKTYNKEDHKYYDTNIVLATLESGQHIMCIENANIGDDISVSSVVNEYTQDIKNLFASAGIVTNKPILSYSDYYLEYSTFIPYISVLPDNKTYTDLKSDNKKLVVNDFWIYQNNFDINLLQQFLASFNDNSVIYAVKQEAGLPVEVYRVTSNGIIYLPVITSVKVTDNVTNYLFDTNYSDVTKVNVLNINNSAIGGVSDRKYFNSYTINYKKIRRKKEEPERPKYYLLKFSNNSLSADNFVPLTTKGQSGNKYGEYKNEYPEIATIGFTDNVYVIAKDNKLAFANYSKKDSLFW